VPNSAVRRLLCIVTLAFLIGSLNPNPGVSAAEDPPAYPYPLAAPWPAGITLHGGGDGFGYGPTSTHKGTDVDAMDFNGNPKKDDPPLETRENDLLVLAVADGCVKEVKYSPGKYVEVMKNGKLEKEWYGDYGWNIVISHPGGYESRYAHLKERPIIPEGKYDIEHCELFVSQGQPLGQIGGTRTENDGAVHIHLALYYCEKSGKTCKNVAVKPEPLDGVEGLPGNDDKAVKVTSHNYGVGYGPISEKALTNPSSLVQHKAIWNVYRTWGGQYGFFGRAKGPSLSSMVRPSSFRSSTLMRSQVTLPR
jgi:peptidase M23-like protein